ncbi:bifunctional pyr operon transcriptional regulator/uracil phosphoribosyltransferase PyrR [bacterium]|nr:bifunctional pyr operon transcriptional regulator/uracil phosphoribosyltransferase PyrR [candidate division CSSED10-310 bacterium]
MSNVAANRIIMTARDIDRILSRFAYEILERFPDRDNLAVVGIQTGGAHLGRRLVQKLEKLEKRSFSFGILDITLYRDDLALEKDQPIVRKTDISFELNQRDIVLIDDVLYTGRTVRAALDALIDFGRPRRIALAVIVDRGLREFPIRPDFIGKEIQTIPEETVRVRLTEEGEPVDQVVLLKED